MMSETSYYEYYMRNINNINLQEELKNLIREYNNITHKNLFIYYGMQIPVPNAEISLCSGDYEKIYHMLRNTNHDTIDLLLSTPGGSGDAAKRIGDFLQSKFNEINILVAGEAKSAGTILAMCGDTINMTETGCLGPIDAQMPNYKGGYYSAFDYVKWVDDKKTLVNNQIKSGNHPYINPVDQIMIAQINPGELEKAKNALEFGKEIVIEWLWKRKFKNWLQTETNKIIVTEEMRKNRAKDIAEDLSNHEKWRDHGRSIKAHELSNKLKINILKDNDNVTEIIYKIHTVCMIMSMSEYAFKIIGSQTSLLIAGVGVALPVQKNIQQNQIHNIKQLFKQNGFVPLNVQCQNCNTINNFVLSSLPKEEIVLKIGSVHGKIVDISENMLQCIRCNHNIDISDLCKQLQNN